MFCWWVAYTCSEGFSGVFAERNNSKIRPCHLSVLDRCHTCNFIARFCRATLSRDKIASMTWHVAQLLNSRATPFPIRAVQLCRKMRWTLIGQLSFMRQSCNVRHGMSHLRFCRAIKLRDKIARQNCRCDISLTVFCTRNIFILYYTSTHTFTYLRDVLNALRKWSRQWTLSMKSTYDAGNQSQRDQINVYV